MPSWHDTSYDPRPEPGQVGSRVVRFLEVLHSLPGNVTPGFVQNHVTTTFYRFPRCLGALCKEPRLTKRAKCNECGAKTCARTKTVTEREFRVSHKQAQECIRTYHKKPLNYGMLDERAPQRHPHKRTLYSDVGVRAPHVPIWSFFSMSFFLFLLE